jgi:two-component system, OmpR family, phosphate regulon sensor histidine kinase PhoR
MQILNPSRWYLHPVFIFSCSIFALAAFLVVTVSWYMEITRALEQIILKFNIDSSSIFPSKTGMTILVLSALITVVLTGILLAFIYYRKTVELYRLQHNFIYNFTHELKTPVTSLRLYVETFIRHSLSPDEIRKYSESMLLDINRLTGNINSILSLARIESRAFESEVTKENLVSIVKKFIRENESLFRNLEIKIEKPPDKRFDYPVNLFLLEMMLINIISNSVKYNESAFPTLIIRFGNFANKATIEFADNGIGVEKKEQKKIFKKFYQSGRKKKSGISGSGLGLYLVYNIAMIHGWRVSVSSKGKSRGATFIVSIPNSKATGIREKYLWKKLKKSVSWL